MKRTQFAFTLIELLVTLAVISILMMVALPSVRYVILNNKITSRTNAFVNTLNYARNEAVTRNIA
ncbi:MAG: prepilin-type N-terminal cleavage/methylation domain-containing protein, partial [Pseudomonadota bacterium]|nr:prepilin-type N-terminal cleavage/methylation domain-containing protein [Pseudomonadota bacterium]